MSEVLFEKSVELAKFFVSQKICEGDCVVDATCGNGHDTLFLSSLVGSSGKVFAFDIQDQAIEKTRLLLEQNSAGQNVELIVSGHEKIDDYIKDPVQLVMFNLGFLPGGDKSQTTFFDTTIQAVEKSLHLLEKGGLILIVFYPGHNAGAIEKREVSAYAAGLSQQEYNVFYLDFINQANYPPTLLGIEKR